MITSLQEMKLGIDTVIRNSQAKHKIFLEIYKYLGQPPDWQLAAGQIHGVLGYDKLDLIKPETVVKRESKINRHHKEKRRKRSRIPWTVKFLYWIQDIYLFV